MDDDNLGHQLDQLVPVDLPLPLGCLVSLRHAFSCLGEESQWTMQHGSNFEHKDTGYELVYLIKLWAEVKLYNDKN